MTPERLKEMRNKYSGKVCSYGPGCTCESNQKFHLFTYISELEAEVKQARQDHATQQNAVVEKYCIELEAKDAKIRALREALQEYADYSCLEEGYNKD